jgi:hypothetical protein
LSTEPGILAIWNDCDPARESEYEHWYRTEHLAERVAVPGFRVGRRYEAVGRTSPRFFTFYELDSAAVLVSAPYLERSNNPTSLTRRIMSEAVFRSASRTACRQVWSQGATRGAYALAVRWTQGDFDAEAERLRKAAIELIDAGTAVRAAFWRGVAEGTGTRSVEQGLRGGPDQSIAAALLVESMRDAELARASRALAVGLGDGTAIGGYRLLCSLSAVEMS